MGVWIDEDGILVRPAEVCSAPIPRREKFASLLESAAPRMREMIQEALNMDLDTEAYAAALRDWARNGKKSRYALTPEEVVRRSAPRPKAVSLAAANFELGQHLHRTGREEEARPFFRQAHRLQPDNWTYKRQAWSLADPFQGQSELYDSCWVKDVKKIGAENYYPPLNLSPASAK